MKEIKLIIAFFVFASIVSCTDKRTPQLQFMPDMYESIPYNPNGSDGYNGEPVNLKPVAGTIAVGGHPTYDIPDTNEGYEKAKTTLLSPIEASEENLANGKKMYDIYCATCHGTKGDGNGVLSQRDKFAGIPNYKDREITPGVTYHVIMHGKNLMGSHASQITYTERWQIVEYVEELRKELAK